MRKLQVSIISVVIFAAAGFYFYSKNRTIINLVYAQQFKPASGNYFDVLMKSPAQIAKEKNADTESAEFDGYEHRRKNRIPESVLFQKLVTYLNTNKISTEIPLCDLSKITGKNYWEDENVGEVGLDIEDTVRLYSKYYMESYCISSRDCDLLFKKPQFINSPEDLEFAGLINSVRNYEELQKLPNHSPNVLFYQALSYGRSLVFSDPENLPRSLDDGALEPTGVDYEKSIRILESLRLGDSRNGAYSYFLIGIKDEAKVDYSRDLEDFLNSEYFYDPYLRLQRILYLQSLSSPYMAVSYLVKRGMTMPKVMYGKTHQVFKQIIPKMSDLQKRKLQQVSLRMIKMYEAAGGRLYGGLYADAENWLRRTHYKDVEALVEWQRNLPKTMYNYDYWSDIEDELSAQTCSTKKIEDLLIKTNEWAAQYKGP